MPSLDTDSIYPATHTLMKSDYHEAMESLAHVALTYGTDVYTLCEGEWLDEDLPNTEECRRVFQQIRETCDRLREHERIREGDAIEYHSRLPDVSGVVEKLLSAGPGICWNHFVSELIIDRIPRPVARAGSRGGNRPHYHLQRCDGSLDIT